MSNVIPFYFENKSIRVVTDENGEPLFVGKDVCQALGFSNPNDAMKDHCRGVAKRYPIADSLGRMQETRVLSEPDVLRLIVNCTLPAAADFERLVFEEILPTIRKTGSYGPVDSLSAAARTQIGGICKAVLHKELADAIAVLVPALLHSEMARHQTSLRRGHTAGQVWNDHKLPTKGLRGYPSWFGNRLSARGCCIADGGRTESGMTTSRLFDPDKCAIEMKKNGLISECNGYIQSRRGQGSLFQ